MASLLTLPESTVRVIQITWIQGSRYAVTINELKLGLMTREPVRSVSVAASRC
jgi:hypothetical protein